MTFHEPNFRYYGIVYFIGIVYCILYTLLHYYLSFYIDVRKMSDS